MEVVLHPHEKKILLTLKKIKSGSPEKIALDSGLNIDSVHKASLWARLKGLIEIKEKEDTVFELTKEGSNYLKSGLPEKIILGHVGEGIEIEELKKTGEFKIGFMWAKKNDWIKIDRGIVELTEKGKEILNKTTEIDDALIKINKYKGEETGEKILRLLESRKLIQKIEKIKKQLLLTRKGEETLEKIKDEGGAAQLTKDIIKSGKWKFAKFRKYDVSIPAAPFFPGKRHILSYYIEKIRRIFLNMGFEEAEGPLVESSFWCFDALFQPQDHPARELADTFFMKTPNETELPGKKLVERVKETHENGGETKSIGWRYQWLEEISKKPVLRTHTTAVSARYLTKIKPPAKIFCIGRTFRNETVDYKHLPEFTQIEGIVVDENVTFCDLLGYLKEFYLKLGFEKVRFRPAYFPYTEMSVEPEVYLKENKEWIELGGAGIFRPEVTAPLGIKCPVLAWGLGLERPIMLKMGTNDIRIFYYKNDLKFLRNFEVF